MVAQVALYFLYATQLCMWLAMPAIVGTACYAGSFFVPSQRTWAVPVYCTALMVTRLVRPTPHHAMSISASSFSPPLCRLPLVRTPFPRAAVPQVWATVFSEHVERSEQIHIFRWGGAKALATDSTEAPAFRDEYRHLLKRRGLDPDAPDPDDLRARVDRSWARRLRLGCSAFTMLLSTALVMAAMAANYVLRLRVEARLPEQGPIVAGLVTGVTIQIMGVAFRGLAGALTEWECWRTASEHEDALIAKIFVFEVWNNYSSLCAARRRWAHRQEGGMGAGERAGAREGARAGEGRARWRQGLARRH